VVGLSYRQTLTELVPSELIAILLPSAASPPWFVLLLVKLPAPRLKSAGLMSPLSLCSLAEISSKTSSLVFSPIFSLYNAYY
jgi:hypothetical protein